MLWFILRYFINYLDKLLQSYCQSAIKLKENHIQTLMRQNQKRLSKDEARARLQSFCAYRDRCHYEVRSKLLELQIYGDDLEEIMSDLVDENFLDEERYARSYARGKFRINKWGRDRIKRELKFRQVSAYCIKKAMTEIEEEVYIDVLYETLEKYYVKLSGKIPIRRNKTYDHGVRRGFESAYILKYLPEIIAKHSNDSDS